MENPFSKIPCPYCLHRQFVLPWQIFGDDVFMCVLCKGFVKINTSDIFDLLDELYV